MKTKLIRALFLSLTAAGSMALVSCQSASTVPTSAVSCSKCGTISFKVPGTAGVGAGGAKGGVVTLRSATSMTCPDCENKVVAVLKTGDFRVHTCKTCGGTLHHCKQH